MLVIPCFLCYVVPASGQWPALHGSRVARQTPDTVTQQLSTANFY